ncbi:MAG: fumarylacetoacetate hydrolase family protein [Anaerolineales bacterium]|jgi:2-keto-4-pentenoate hydratase/2-oxohepta-3-ene-1,7-dioic acid hydratase in catechol pathway
MRIIRFLHNDDQPRYGWIFEDRVGPIIGDIFSEYQRQEAEIPISEVTLLAPVKPSKVVCVGRNYAAHAEEHGAEVPEYPLIFLKPPSSVISIGQPILLPPQSNQVEHEAELGVVIGRRARWLQPEDAMGVVFGYTVANDVTARDLQRRDGQWTRGKGFDTFCPVGPWVDTEFDPSETMISCHVGDELRQMATTRDMVFSIPQLLVYITSVMTLEPGDLVLTGTPSGVGILQAGETVSITIEGLGELSNPVQLDPRRKE